MNGVQTRFKCKLDVKRCKRFVFPPSSLLPRSNALKTKAIRYFQTDRTLTRIVSPPLQKTGQQLFIRWEKPMQEIVDKYDTSGTPFLLPIIRDMEADNRKQYKCESYRVNQSLKKIGKQLGLTISLTSYVARHSWASIAKSKNIPVATISEAMGHDSEHTTRIYLASLDTTVVDKANSLILKSL